MTQADPTSFTRLQFVERSEREMFDRRSERLTKTAVFVFRAEFNDHTPIEIAVNREFKTEVAARMQDEFYAAAFGRLPLLLRAKIEALHIQAGKATVWWWSQDSDPTEQGQEYERDGILEETLAHEAAHALDEEHAGHPAWRAAQRKDDRFLSAYASSIQIAKTSPSPSCPTSPCVSDPIESNASNARPSKSDPARLDYFDTLKPEGFPKLRPVAE